MIADDSTSELICSGISLHVSKACQKWRLFKSDRTLQVIKVLLSESQAINLYVSNAVNDTVDDYLYTVDDQQDTYSICELEELGYKKVKGICTKKHPFKKV